MKTKFFTLLTAVTLLGSAAKAQSTFDVGTNVINLGVGLFGGYSYGAYNDVTRSPALSAYYERSAFQLGPGKLGLGAGLEFANTYYNYPSGGYKASWTYTIVGLRAAYHLDVLSQHRFDPYLGLALGFQNVSYSDTYVWLKRDNDYVVWIRRLF